MTFWGSHSMAIWALSCNLQFQPPKLFFWQMDQVTEQYRKSNVCSTLVWMSLSKGDITCGSTTYRIESRNCNFMFRLSWNVWHQLFIHSDIPSKKHLLVINSRPLLQSAWSWCIPGSYTIGSALPWRRVLQRNEGDGAVRFIQLHPARSPGQIPAIAQSQVTLSTNDSLVRCWLPKDQATGPPSGASISSFQEWCRSTCLGQCLSG